MKLLREGMLMKYVFILFAAVVVVAFSACQKEIDWGWGGQGGNRLVKTISKTGSDSTITEYSYDAQGRLIKEKTTGVSAGLSLNGELIIVRNSAGIITETIQKSDALQQVGIDSVVTKVNYDASFSRYRSAVFQITALGIPGMSVKDSTAFFYDTQVRINSEIRYQSVLGTPLIPFLKTDYTYSAAGNIAEIKRYTFNVSTLSYNLISTTVNTYDSAINPLKAGNDAIVILRTNYASAGNVIQTDFSSSQNPAASFTQSTVYTYNSNNRPRTSVSTRTPGGAVTNTTFYYQ